MGYRYLPSAATTMLVLMTIGAIAVIVLSILGYRMFLGKSAAHNRENAWGKFFNFDHLYLDKILKTFFLIGTVINVVCAVLTPLFMAAAGGGTGFFLGVFVAIILFCIFELGLRLGYEYLLMFVRMSVDVRHLRRSVVGAESELNETVDESLFHALVHSRPSFSPEQAGADGAASAVSAAPVAAAAPAAETSAAPAATPAAPAADTGAWVCPSCGTQNALGRFCGKCGTPRA